MFHLPNTITSALKGVPSRSNAPVRKEVSRNTREQERRRLNEQVQVDRRRLSETMMRPYHRSSSPDFDDCFQACEPAKKIAVIRDIQRLEGYHRGYNRLQRKEAVCRVQDRWKCFTASFVSPPA